jgi:hypothetical protein
VAAALALVRPALSDPQARLALEVLADGPYQLRRALELGDLLVERAERSEHFVRRRIG